MTSQEFVIWMKGFMEACNDFTATPKQWDRIKEVLSSVNDHSSSIYTYSNPGSTWTYSNGENKKQQLND